MQAAHADPVAPVLLALVWLGLGAALGGRLMQRLGVPAVVGELGFGLLVGNLGYWIGSPTLMVLRTGEPVRRLAEWAWVHGATLAEAARHLLPPGAATERVAAALATPAGLEAVSVYLFVDQVSRLAVVFLMFLVGLEMRLEELARVGVRAVAVAATGVVAPLVLGAAVVRWLAPAGLPRELYIGGVLTATSVGITARVLTDLHQMHRREAHLILGAAVVDDVLGLLLLAVLAAEVVGGGVTAGAMGALAAGAVVFVGGAMAAGLWVLPRLARHRLWRRLGLGRARLAVGVVLAFLLAWVASRIGLATIVGAFAAGVLVERLLGDAPAEQPSLRELLSPLELLVVPLFFVLLGLEVRLETLASRPALVLGGALLGAAVAGKLAAGLAAGSGLRRWVVGLGMLPRGEVGLLFASVGRSIGALTDAEFSALVLVAVLTTLVSPVLLARALQTQ
jgi:Kef-type K+ transport system membrane component KefB